MKKRSTLVSMVGIFILILNLLLPLGQPSEAAQPELSATEQPTQAPTEGATGDTAISEPTVAVSEAPIDPTQPPTGEPTVEVVATGTLVIRTTDQNSAVVTGSAFRVVDAAAAIHSAADGDDGSLDGLVTFAQLAAGPATITQTLSAAGYQSAVGDISAEVLADDTAEISVLNTMIDADADGIGDMVDNCPDVTNSDQADADENGRGDLCDTLLTEPASVAAAIAILAGPSLSLDKTAPNGPFQVGEYIGFRFIVTNTGDVPLRDVYVDDAFLGQTTWIGDLAPGAMRNIDATYYFVTEDDLLAGSVVNTAVAYGCIDEVAPEDRVSNAYGFAQGAACDDPIESNSDTTTSLIASNIDLNLSKYADVELADVGDTITYEFDVWNYSDLPASNVVIHDAMPGLVWEAGYENGIVGNLLANEGATVSATYVVTDEDLAAGTVFNTAYASGNVCAQSCSPVRSRDVDSIVGVTVIPSISIEKTADLSEAEVGDTITYTISVTNDGANAVSNIRVVDYLSASGSVNFPDGLTIPELEAGATVVITGTYAVSKPDLVSGYVVNTAFAYFEVCGGEGQQAVCSTIQTISAQATTTVLGDPLLSFDKIITQVDYANGDSGTISDPTTVIEGLVTGDVVHYQITLEALTEGLNSIGIGDYNLDGVDCSMPEATYGEAWLDAGESIVCTGTYTIDIEDMRAGQFTNSAYVWGQFDAGGESFSLNDWVTVYTEELLYDLKIDKAVSPVGPVQVGDTLTYSFTVGIPEEGYYSALENVVVNDPMPGLEWQTDDGTGFIGDLQPGESSTIFATYLVTEADFEAGAITNTASATGEYCEQGEGSPERTTDAALGFFDWAPDVCIPFASPPDTVTVVVANPQLALVKTGSTGGPVVAGDTVSYTFKVTNTGTVTLENIVVEDDMLALAEVVIPPVGTLDPGESTTVSADYVVTAADVAAGQIDNIAFAQGDYCKRALDRRSDSTRGFAQIEPDCEEVISPPDDWSVTTASDPKTPIPGTPEPKTPEAGTVTPPSTPISALPKTGQGDFGSGSLAVPTLLLLATVLAGLAWVNRRSRSVNQ